MQEPETTKHITASMIIETVLASVVLLLAAALVVLACIGQETPQETVVGLTGALISENNSSRVPLRININTATQSELKKLNGVGEVIAGRIISYRDKNGGFKSVDELINVKGIGEKVLEKIKEDAVIE